jgi:hypothetical protein
MRQAALAAALVCCLQAAHADDPENVWLGTQQALGLLESAVLIITDQVAGECWTNVDSVEKSIRRKLEQSGIAVKDQFPEGIDNYQITYAFIHAHAFGGLRSGLCHAGVSFDVKRRVLVKNHPVVIDTTLYLFKKGAVIFHSASLNSLISDAMSKLVAEFTADVLRARRDPEVQKAKQKLANEAAK